MKVQLSVELFQRIVLSDAPFKVIPPPSAVVSEGEATEPSSIFLSSTVTVVELTVVVVPLTVKFPVIVTSSGRPIVTVFPVTAVPISFAVPEKVKVSPVLTTSVAEPSEIVKLVEMEAVLAAVSLP